MRKTQPSPDGAANKAREAVGVSIVIPVYRSQATLLRLFERVAPVLEGAGRRYEIILVDDASPDESWRVIRELQARDPERIVAVQLMRNFGQHNALMCGLRHARGKYVITMADDLQHPPEEITTWSTGCLMPGSTAAGGTSARPW